MNAKMKKNIKYSCNVDISYTMRKSKGVCNCDFCHFFLKMAGHDISVNDVVSLGLIGYRDPLQSPHSLGKWLLGQLQTLQFYLWQLWLVVGRSQTRTSHIDCGTFEHQMNFT